MSDDQQQQHGTHTDFPPLPPAPPSHVVGQGYSSSHPVPTVQDYRKTQAEHEQQANEYAEIVRKRQQEQEMANQRVEPGGAGLPDGEEKSGDAAGVPEAKVVKEEGNAAKTQQDKKESGGAKGPATEKQRMMDQMNANQREPLLAE